MCVPVGDVILPPLSQIPCWRLFETVIVFAPGSPNKLMAEFPAGKSQILPRGLYEVKIQRNGMESERSDVLVLSSKTSELKVRS